MLLTALDDPIANWETVPYHEVEVNPHIILATTDKGGHIGWFELAGLKPKRWAHKPVSEFINAIFEVCFCAHFRSNLLMRIIQV